MYIQGICDFIWIQFEVLSLYFAIIFIIFYLFQFPESLNQEMGWGGAV